MIAMSLGQELQSQNKEIFDNFCVQMFDLLLDLFR